MQPGARVQAVIELLEEVKASGMPADLALRRYVKARRYIGSKDRAFISDLFYGILRHRSALDWWCERGDVSPSSRLRALVALHFLGKEAGAPLADMFSGGKFAPAPLNEKEATFAARLTTEKNLLHPDMPEPARFNYPAWLEPHLAHAFPENREQELAALMQEAPLDLRVNTLKTTREKMLEELSAEGFDPIPTPLSPLGIRLMRRHPVTATRAFRGGFIEVQDEGSQLTALLASPKPSDTVIDFCAGAGGKTLALAAQMRNRGIIHAWDVSESRLAQMSPRLERAGVTIVQTSIIPDAEKRDFFCTPHRKCRPCRDRCALQWNGNLAT